MLWLKLILDIKNLLCMHSIFGKKTVNLERNIFKK